MSKTEGRERNINSLNKLGHSDDWGHSPTKSETFGSLIGDIHPPSSGTGIGQAKIDWCVSPLNNLQIQTNLFNAPTL